MTFKLLHLKILVLIIVIVIWSIQSLMKVHHKEIELPVRFDNLREDLIISPESPEYLYLFVEGRGIEIYNFKKKNNYIEVDAKDFRLGDNEVHITEHNLVLEDPNFRTSIDFHINKTAEFNFDKITRKEVAVVKRFLTLEDELYFQQRNAYLSPPTVEIEGPEQQIKDINTITTTPISAGIISETSHIVELEIPEDVLGIKPDAVEIILETTPITSKNITMIPIDYPEEQEIMIIPQYLTVKVGGSAKIVSSLSADNINAYVDIPPSYEHDFIDINVEVPEGVDILEYTPRRVQIIRTDSED